MNHPRCAFGASPIEEGAAGGPAKPGLPSESAGAQAVQADTGRLGAAAFAPRRPLEAWCFMRARSGDDAVEQTN